MPRTLVGFHHIIIHLKHPRAHPRACKCEILWRTFPSLLIRDCLDSMPSERHNSTRLSVPAYESASLRWARREERVVRTISDPRIEDDEMHFYEKHSHIDIVCRGVRVGLLSFFLKGLYDWNGMRIAVNFPFVQSEWVVVVERAGLWPRSLELVILHHVGLLLIGAVRAANRQADHQFD